MIQRSFTRPARRLCRPEEETPALLEKAERSVRAAENLLRHGDPDFAASRAYYAMFYVAEALLREEGLEFSKHAGVHAAFGRAFAKSGRVDPNYHRWLLDAFDQRIAGDYGIEPSLSIDDARIQIDRAREFLAEARRQLRA